MKEKVRRILDLVRAGKLTLDDAAPLLAALSPRMALVAADQELIQTLLERTDLQTDQIAEHLMLLRGVKSPSGVPQPPEPPRPRGFTFNWTTDGNRRRNSQTGTLDDLDERITAKLEQAAGKLAAKAERLGQNVEERMDQFARDVERAVDSWDTASNRTSAAPTTTAPPPRILRIQVESEDGDSYQANLPLGLAAHLEKLVPPHGVKALQKAGFTLEALQLMIEAGAPAGELVRAEDSDGNSVQIILK